MRNGLAFSEDDGHASDRPQTAAAIGSSRRARSVAYDEGREVFSSTALSSCSLDSASEVFHLGSSMSDIESSAGMSVRNPMPQLTASHLPPVPGCFRCPVSQQIMEDPVLLDDNRTYDRASVASLGYAGAVRPNEPLRDAIKGYFELVEEMEHRQQHWMHHLARREQKVARALLHRKEQVHALRDALENSRRRARELQERRATAESSGSSTTASSQEGRSGSATPTGSDHSHGEEVHGEDDAEKVQFRSGPAPRSSDSLPLHRQPVRRRSSWSQVLPGVLARYGGCGGS